jgi:glutamate 5-kinase
MLQAVAAIGQNALMNRFSSCFEAHNVQSAQILLTWDDFNDRKRYLNAKDTIMTLLKLGSVPIINENDTVSTEEIKFGDNDKLSALVAKLVNADLLIMLSDVDGLLDRDGKTVIRIVDEINAGVKALGYPTTRKTSVGGMITKIEAAKIAIDSGIPCVIAHGHIQGIINSIIHKPCEQGTTFLSKKALCAKDHWIAFGTKVKGQVVVDEGAKKALLNKKSLLSVGITGLAGSFQAGDIVSIMDKEGNSLARGKISISSEVLEKIKGKRYEKEIIHRDNIVIL